MSLPKCLLRCVNNTHEPISLEHGKEVVVGRGPETKIKDSRCSRNQVSLKADGKALEVIVTQIGRNACGFNGTAMKKDMLVKMHNGDKLDILLTQYTHVIEFDVPQDETNKTSKAAPESRLNVSDSENSDDNEPIAKKLKTSEKGEICNGDVSKCWESLDGGKLVMYSSADLVKQTAIAAFDLDGTIITTNSGAVFPKNKEDWKILYPQVLSKLRELHEAKYKLVIFTNQAGIWAGKQKVADFKAKITSVVSKIQLPIQVMIATGYSLYRKPCTRMWEVAVERNGGSVDMKKSFYCGDAAGRDSSLTAKKDFSQTDYLFSKNVGLRFETPESLFLKMDIPTLEVKVFDPNSIPCDVPLCDPHWGQVISNKPEIVVLVGCPGSGKTTFALTHLVSAGYVHVNRDTLGSWSRCVALTEQGLRNKQRIVVDNTSPTVESRKRYVDVGKNMSVPVRCFVMNTNIQHARHNFKFRQLIDPNTTVNDAVIPLYIQKYEEPGIAEGFTEVLKINFWPTFKDPTREKLYMMYLLEKSIWYV